MHLNVLLTSMNRFTSPTNSIAALSAIVLASTKPDILTVVADDDGAFLMPFLCLLSIPLEMLVPNSSIVLTTGNSNWDSRGVSSLATKVGETPFIVDSDNFIVPEEPKPSAHALVDMSNAAQIKNTILAIW